MHFKISKLSFKIRHKRIHTVWLHLIQNSRKCESKLRWWKADPGLPGAGIRGKFPGKGHKGMFWGKDSISWLLWWLHRCIHLSKFFKLHILNGYDLFYSTILYLSTNWFLKRNCLHGSFSAACSRENWTWWVGENDYSFLSSHSNPKVTHQRLSAPHHKTIMTGLSAANIITPQTKEPQKVTRTSAAISSCIYLGDLMAILTMLLFPTASFHVDLFAKTQKVKSLTQSWWLSQLPSFLCFLSFFYIYNF